MLANGGCERICVNTQGSFHCECPDGYELGNTLFECNGRYYTASLYFKKKIYIYISRPVLYTDRQTDRTYIIMANLFIVLLIEHVSSIRSSI